MSTAGVGREVEVRLRRGGSERSVRVSLAQVSAAEEARAHAQAVIGQD